jgi:hypothetical protein
MLFEKICYFLRRVVNITDFSTLVNNLHGSGSVMRIHPEIYRNFGKVYFTNAFRKVCKMGSLALFQALFTWIA